MRRQQSRVWIVVGVGMAALTAVGFYLYLRSSRPSHGSRVRRVEAIIREAEALIRQHR